MHKCLDLSRLPKAPGLRSINRRNVTPGSPLPLLFPGTAPYNPARTVDPTHPATRWKAQAFPHFSCPAFTLRAVPKGALPLPDSRGCASQAERSPMVLHTDRNRKNGPKSLDMSIFFMIAKKKTDKRAVVRNRIAMRIRSAFELIVARGADAEPKDNVEGRRVSKEPEPGLGPGPQESASSNVARNPKKKPDRSVQRLKLASLASSIAPSNLGLVSNPASTEHLILQDWTYVMSPSLLSYRMPLPDLIQHLRAGLESIRAQSTKLDLLWALNKKSTRNLPFAHITNKEPEPDWRQFATDEDDLPMLFDLDEPEHGLIKRGKPQSINTQKRPLKLFFPTSLPTGESPSASVTDENEIVAFPGCTDMPIRSAPAYGPSYQSSDSVSDSSEPTQQRAPSAFRIGALERLASVKRQPLVVPDRRRERGGS
ncbi:hypothetical protein DEU56DRAFT_918268 [Suillus clintonianus]|uniref:uncharacterized protein n=1 Tax=Suillus clintonianus TaxID=1904413 RepID=UPI001B861FD7|nr:uncharacterized protein DEU56DRAFT_918268 [Suillus clintonianus]KAG2121262.1 hypothetical protein DEU56DRAFT_918268 [Suillus clintonianus]